jgi:hypothetical protein
MLTVKVFFVIAEDDEVVAVIPELKGEPGMCVCYGRVGYFQRSKEWVSDARAATFTEYSDLFAELCHSYYALNLEVIEHA